MVNNDNPLLRAASKRFIQCERNASCRLLFSCGATLKRRQPIIRSGIARNLGDVDSESERGTLPPHYQRSLVFKLTNLACVQSIKW